MIGSELEVHLVFTSKIEDMDYAQFEMKVDSMELFLLMVVLMDGKDGQ